MEKNLFRYTWTHTRLQQLWVLFIVLASMVPYYLSFDLPKLIVNGPIQGRGFETPDATQTYLPISFNLPGIGPVNLFGGITVDRFSSLVLLCGIFLLLVVVNGGFKFYINTYKGRLGERMLRRIRFDLVDRVLRFPPSQFKRLKPSEIATMVKDEVEPLGGFIGDAFVQPALLGGQAMTALVFILVQDLWLGLIAAGIVAVQLLIIPKMRKRLIRLGRERQLTARELSGRIGEISEGIAAIHTHDTSNYERAEISARLGRIFRIRYDLYQWKFLVKFLNNFLSQVTPFLFYIIGGYLVIRGSMDVGQLVAVIAAYKDLPGPLKDLIDWDQIRQDVAVKYAQVHEQFDVEGVLAPRLQLMDANPVHVPGQALSAVNVSLIDDSGARLLERTSLTINPGESIAVVGSSGAGGEALAEAFARLVWPASGKIMVGDKEIADLAESLTGRRISYASFDSYLFQGSLYDNLTYGLKHAPYRPRQYAEKDAAGRAWEVAEARKSGNPDFDIQSDWIDYAAVNIEGPEQLLGAILPVLDGVLLAGDILELGLRSTTNGTRHPGISGRIVEVRKAFRARLESENMGALVVPFEFGAYNPEATVSENLLFGAASGSVLALNVLAADPYLRSVLTSSGLDEPLYTMGLEIASNVVELFQDLPPDHPFFQQLDLMTAEEIPQYQSLLQKLQGRAFASVSEDDRTKMTTLSFGYVEPLHRFGLLDAELMARIVAARAIYREQLPAGLSDRFEPYDPDQFNSAANLMDNVLFGRIGHRQADAGERVRAIVREILHELNLFPDVISVGLEFGVGVGGKRLTASQRQKLNLARALLKRPEFLILNKPLSALDQQSQRQITVNVLDWAKAIDPKPGIFWVLANPVHAPLFDRVVVFDKGMMTGDGNYDTLLAKNSALKALVS